MTRKTHDIAANVGEYTDRNGNTKKRWLKCGAAFTDDQGRISLKLDGIPVSPDWSGWLSLFEPRDSDSGAQEQRRDAGSYSEGGDSGSGRYGAENGNGEHIPF